MALQIGPNGFIQDSNQKLANGLLSRATPNNTKGALVLGPLGLLQDSTDQITNGLLSQAMGNTQAIAQATQVADSPGALPQMITASMQPEAEIAKATNGKSSYVQSTAVQQLTAPVVATGNRDSLANIKPLTKTKEAEVPEQTLQAHDKIKEHNKQVAHNQANSHDNATGNIKFVAGNSIALDSVHRSSFTSDGMVVIQAPHKETHVTGSVENYVHKTEWGHLSTAAIDSRVIKSTTSAKYTVTDLTVASEVQGLVGKSGYRDTADFIHDTTTHMRNDASIVDVRASQSASIRSIGSINHQAKDSYLLSIGNPTPQGQPPAFFMAGGTTLIAKDILSQVGFSGLGNISANKGYVKTIDNEGQMSVYSMSRDIFSMKVKEVTSRSKKEVIGKEHHTISKGLVTNLSKGISLEGISGGVLKLSNKKFSVIMRGLLGDVAGPIVDKIMGCMQFPELPQLPEVDIPNARGIDLTQILDLKCGKGGDPLQPMGHQGPTDPSKTSGGNIAEGHKGTFPTTQNPSMSARNTFPSRSVPGGTIPPIVEGAGGVQTVGTGNTGPNGSTTSALPSPSSTSSTDPSGSAQGGASQSSVSISTQGTVSSSTQATKLNAVVSPVFNTPIGVYMDRYMGDTLPGSISGGTSSSTETTGPGRATLRAPGSDTQDVTQTLLSVMGAGTKDANKILEQVFTQYAQGQLTREQAQQRVSEKGLPLSLFDSLLDSDAYLDVTPSLQYKGGVDVGKVGLPVTPLTQSQAGLTGILSHLINEKVPQQLANPNHEDSYALLGNIAKQVGIDPSALMQYIGNDGQVNTGALVTGILGNLNLPDGVKVNATQGEGGRYSLDISANEMLDGYLSNIKEMVGGMGPLKKVYGVLDQLGIGDGLQDQVSTLLDQVMACATNWLNLKAVIGLPVLDLSNIQSLFPKAIAGVPIADAQNLMKSIGVSNPMELASMLGDVTKMDLSSLPDVALKLLKGWGLCKKAKNPLEPMGHQS